MALDRTPFVSVVIPTYNRERLLSRAIASLLDQTYPQSQYEIVIVDDGSTDATDHMVQQLAAESTQRIRYLRQNRSGPAAARNLGIQHSQGEIIGFTDSDCIVDGHWIEQAVRSLGDARYGGVSGITLSDAPPSPFVHTVVDAEAQAKTCNLALRKSVVQEAGGFDESFGSPWLEDFDLISRVQQDGERIRRNPEMVVVHPSQYQSFLDYLRRTRFEQYHVLMAAKSPQQGFGRYFLAVVGKSIAVLALPVVLLMLPVPSVSIGWRFAVLASVLCSAGACKLVRLRAAMRSHGMAIVGYDQVAFVLLHWVVHVSRGFYLIKGIAKFWRPRQQVV
jgi:glycosyltransferase involved in cell wall biosynthesis